MDARIRSKFVWQLLAQHPKSPEELNSWAQSITKEALARFKQLQVPTTILGRFLDEIQVDSKGPVSREPRSRVNFFAEAQSGHWRRLVRYFCKTESWGLRARNWPLKGIDDGADQTAPAIVLLWDAKIRAQRRSTEEKLDLVLCRGAARFVSKHCFSNAAPAELLDLREMRSLVPRTNAKHGQKRVWIGPAKKGEEGRLWKGASPAEDRPSIRAEAAEELCTFFLCNDVAHTFDKRYWFFAGPKQLAVIVSSRQPVHWSKPQWSRT